MLWTVTVDQYSTLSTSFVGAQTEGMRPVDTSAGRNQMIKSALGSIRDRGRSLAFGQNLRALEHALNATQFPLAEKTGVRVYRSSTVVLECRIDDLRVAFDISVGPRAAALSVIGRDDVARRVLRNAFIGVGVNVRANGERNVLGTWRLLPRRNRAVKSIVDAILVGMARVATLPGETRPDRELVASDALTYWWDTKANFGDTVGPWLVSAITGLRPVNSRWVRDGSPALFTVGSVIGHLKTPGDHIWGSGLIGRPGASKLNQLRNAPPTKIHAVRGKWTRDVLVHELGWTVPEVYGDPALLLPRYYAPSPSRRTKKIALVPHYKHKKDFATLSGGQANLVDVAGGLEGVVDQISSSSAVISTSLHGLIIAQAYGVPWVWMRLDDKQLGGDTFKFEDFFSLLSRDEVATLDLSTNELGKIDLQKIARQARLPKSFYDLQLLEDSFPSHLFTEARHG